MSQELRQRVEDAVKQCDEMESRCNEVWQHIDNFHTHLKQVDSDLKDIKTTVIVLMKLLNNFIDHKE